MIDAIGGVIAVDNAIAVNISRDAAGDSTGRRWWRRRGGRDGLLLGARGKRKGTEPYEHE